jgi:hypothetical protein
LEVNYVIDKRFRTFYILIDHWPFPRFVKNFHTINYYFKKWQGFNSSRKWNLRKGTTIEDRDQRYYIQQILPQRKLRPRRISPTENCNPGYKPLVVEFSVDETKDKIEIILLLFHAKSVI